jgi:hypothetical protein
MNMNNIVMEKVSYGGWKNCIRLANDKIELIVTTDVGPRIIRLGTIGGQNLFKEYKDQLGKVGGQNWNNFGGHRLWHAPEAKPRTYYPDNETVGYAWNGQTLALTQNIESTTGIGKEIEITLNESDNHVKVLHRLINRNMWDIKASPWCLTVMAQNGCAIIPNEPYRAHTEYLLPARPMVLWHYTNMADKRWKWGTKYVQLRQNPNVKTPQKLGVFNSQGWVAYYLNKQLFLKRYGCVYGPYPDFGCNTEIFTNSAMLELETLGPLATLDAGMGKTEHVEHWFICDIEVEDDEDSIERNVLPVVNKTDVYLV